MKRAIVIRGADFSQNKLKTVTLIDVVPCTGIEFDETTFAIEGYDTETVAYTLEPSNTTDEVTWVSSNQNIVTVDDAVITPVGVGSCTITATCGTHTATATVTVTIKYIPDWELGMIGYNSTDGFIKHTTSDARVYTLGSGVQQAQYRIQASTEMHPVKLPPNTGRVKIKVTDTSKVYNASSAQIVWAKDENVTPSSPYFIHALSAEEMYNAKTESEKTYTVPNGADSFAFTLQGGSSVISQYDTVNAYAAAAGLSIEFLPPAT